MREVEGYLSVHAGCPDCRCLLLCTSILSEQWLQQAVTFFTAIPAAGTIATSVRRHCVLLSLEVHHTTVCERVEAFSLAAFCVAAR